MNWESSNPLSDGSESEKSEEGKKKTLLCCHSQMETMEVSSLQVAE